jgi:hypothetical protein
MRKAILTYAAVQTLLGGQRVRILAKRDPLRNLPAGTFTLADYSYVGAELCHGEFGNCRLHSLGVA